MKKILALVAILGASYSLQGAKRLKYLDIKSRVENCQMTPAQADQTAYAKSALTGPHYNRVQKQELVALYKKNCAKKAGPSATIGGGGATPAPAPAPAPAPVVVVPVAGGGGAIGGGVAPAPVGPTPAPAGPSTPSLSDQIRQKITDINTEADKETGLKGVWNKFDQFANTNIDGNLIAQHINPILENMKDYDRNMLRDINEIINNDTLTLTDQVELLKNININIRIILNKLDALKTLSQTNLSLDDDDYRDYQNNIINPIQGKYRTIYNEIKALLTKANAKK